MIFTSKTIAPHGRNKYGNYYSTGNITKSVITTTYAGNNTTTTIVPENPEENVDDKSFYCILSKNQATFDALDLIQGTSDSTTVIAYRGYDKAPVYICDMANVVVTEEDGVIQDITPPANMGLVDIPSGISVTFSNNGTSAATITFYADSDLTGNTGTIQIPCVIYKRSEATPKPDDILDWYKALDYCEQVWLDFTWVVNRNGASTYVLDLSNERAGVNCDSAGTIYTASTATLTCTASTYYGSEVVQGATYSISIQPRYNAVGVSISQSTGVLQWASNFSFTGPNLPIDVIAYVDGNPVATKTMSIDKNYPGPDGSPAVTRWIVTDYDVVTYNPNTDTINPTKVQAWVMKQEGGDEPERDNTTTIYYGYDTTTPTQPLPSTGAAAYSYVSAITFALKNSSNVYYEIETVPILWAGVDGTDGVDGSDGEDGQDGESAYYLTLSNDNASINADSDGNILPYAIKPTCKTKLYYGSTRITSATYTIDAGTATGVTITTSNGIGTINFADNFNFTGDTLAISVSGSTNNSVMDVKIMNVTKARAGAEGEDAVSYWLTPNYGEIIYNPNTNAFSPSSISVVAYQQRGEEAITPSPASETTIKYQWQSRSTGSWTSETTYTRGSSITITSGICESYSRLRFTLYKGSNQVDQEDIDILRDGADGAPGQGRAGAAIRGPYDYASVSASTRCWCAGQTGGTCSDCDKWIDVILKDDTYYYCNTTYYGPISPWNTYKNYWTSGDTFDFVAAKLILAPNASIDFLTNNELYLRNSNGDITAGAAGGNGINFWAGASAPGDAPFTVSNDGTMVAKKGTFGPFTIGDDEYGKSALNSSGTSSSEGYNYRDDITMNSYSFSLSSTESKSSSASTTSLSIIANQSDSSSELQNSIIQLDMGKYPYATPSHTPYDRAAMQTNANIKAGRFVGNRGCAVTSSPYDTQIIFTTSSNTLFNKSTYWHINGFETNIPFIQPRALFRQSGNRWYYGNEDLGVSTTASTVNFTSGTSESRETWTFNGADLGIDTTQYPNSVVFDTEYNAWCATYGSYTKRSTGIEHPTSGYGTPNAVYREVENTYPLTIQTSGLYGYERTKNRGYFCEIDCSPASSSGSGYIVVTPRDSSDSITALTMYTSDSWLTASRSSSTSNTVTISVASSGVGRTRYGYVELYINKKYGVRINYRQTAE